MIQDDRIVAFVAGRQPQIGAGTGVMRALVRTEMDVINVKASDLLVVGRCVNMTLPGPG